VPAVLPNRDDDGHDHGHDHEDREDEAWRWWGEGDFWKFWDSAN
jgi:hypothetical protein